MTTFGMEFGYVYTPLIFERLIMASAELYEEPREDVCRGGTRALYFMKQYVTSNGGEAQYDDIP